MESMLGSSRRTKRRFQYCTDDSGIIVYFRAPQGHSGRNLIDPSQLNHEANTLNIDDEVLRKRMEKSIVVPDENHEPMMVNEADMDFRIPGLPHSVVKHAQSTSVRELIQKIENRPDRHALQQDLRLNQSFNPFRPEEASPQQGCKHSAPQMTKARTSPKTGGGKWCGRWYTTTMFIHSRRCMQLIRVTERLGASSRRPRHPFPP